MNRAYPLLLLSLSPLVGTLALVPKESALVLAPSNPVVRLGRLPPTETLGLNFTTGSASVPRTLPLTTTNVFYLNNTGSSYFWVHLEVVSAIGLPTLGFISVGINNGTRTDEILVQSGAITQSVGPLVRLSPLSTNRIDVRRSILSPNYAGTTLDMRLVVDDSTDASGRIVGSIRVRITP